MRIDKKQLNLFNGFLTKWERERGHAYSYFDLFNYFFPTREYSPKSIQAIWQKFIKERRKQDKIDFYIHIPYCFQKCDYCISGSAKLKNRQELEIYIALLTRIFSDFKKVFSSVEFTNLYIGGGTPSVLSESSFNRVFSSLFSSFNFKKGGERTCELNPINSSFNKLSLLKKNGFNRISFGVQSFDKKVLDLNNRGYQTVQLVEKAVADTKRAGFKNTNLDLIVGLAGGNKRALLKSIDRAVHLDATSISLYPLQPTSFYLNKYFNSNNDKFVVFLKKLIVSSEKEINQIARKNQWHISPTRISIDDAFIKNGSWHIGRESFKNCADHYGADDGNSVFAVGNGSESSIENKMQYFARWEKTPAGSFKVSYRGTPNDKVSQMLYYTSKKLVVGGYISKSDFKNNFGLSFSKKFEESISRLKKLGIIQSSSKDKIYFKKNKLNESFLHLLFFLEEANAKLVSYREKMKKTNTKKTNTKEKGQKSAVSGDVLDGAVAKKNKGSILVETEMGNEKVLLTQETEFVVMKLSSPNELVSQKKIKYADIKIGDGVSVVLDKNSQEMIALMVRKIISLF